MNLMHKITILILSFLLILSISSLKQINDQINDLNNQDVLEEKQQQENYQSKSENSEENNRHHQNNQSNQNKTKKYKLILVILIIFIFLLLFYFLVFNGDLNNDQINQYQFNQEQLNQYFNQYQDGQQKISLDKKMKCGVVLDGDQLLLVRCQNPDPNLLKIFIYKDIASKDVFKKMSNNNVRKIIGFYQLMIDFLSNIDNVLLKQVKENELIYKDKGGEILLVEIAKNFFGDPQNHDNVNNVIRLEKVAYLLNLNTKIEEDQEGYGYIKKKKYLDLFKHVIKNKKPRTYGDNYRCLFVHFVTLYNIIDRLREELKIFFANQIMANQFTAKNNAFKKITKQIDKFLGNE